jgi:hypothetical protein
MITDPRSRFSLIPVLPEGGGGPPLQLEELGVPLVREAKFEVMGPDLGAEDALVLEKQVERLDALIREDRLAEADGLAEECLSRVLHFPEHRPAVLRKWWILPLVLIGILAMILCALFLIL